MTHVSTGIAKTTCQRNELEGKKKVKYLPVATLSFNIQEVYHQSCQNEYSSTLSKQHD